MPGARVGHRRSRDGQRDPGDDFGGGRRTHVPLTHAEAMLALDQIEMDVSFVVAVGSGPEHCREPMARAVAYFVAKVLRNVHIRQAKNSSIGQCEGAQIDRIAFSVLAELGARDPVAAAAFEIIRGFQPSARRRQACLPGARPHHEARRQQIPQMHSAAPEPV